jgi:NAD(P)-dependent dehydrogenase (short-subunit alcohol dehydrogenase family)
VEKWGPPHGLINNAALDSPPNSPAEENGPFETYPEDSWDKVMNVNAKGVFLCCQAVGGLMAEAGRGSIINICSIYGLVSPDQRIYRYRESGGGRFFKPVAYSVSKSSLLNMTRYLATYWAESNVRVNTVTFGGVFNNQDEEFLKGYRARVPLGRMANEDEYNGAIIFLLSDASSYMTGSNMVMDGGWTAW